MLPYLVLLAVLVILGSSGKAIAYVAGMAQEIDLRPIGGGHQLRADAAQAFLSMQNKAVRDGVVVYINSSFRTMAEQRALYADYQAGSGNLAAMPGYSSHQNGIAVDIDVDGSFMSGTYQWLAINAKSYGFVNTGAGFSQKEPWHWEYKGVS